MMDYAIVLMGGLMQPFQLEQYVTEVLLGEGVAASNITFTGGMSLCFGYLSCGVKLDSSEGMSLHTTIPYVTIFVAIVWEKEEQICHCCHSGFSTYRPVLLGVRCVYCRFGIS